VLIILVKIRLIIVPNSPAKIALRKGYCIAWRGLALDAFVCRFYINDVEPYVSPYCPVLWVLAGYSVPLSKIGLLTGLAA
jgi:hypothetical protein